MIKRMVGNASFVASSQALLAAALADPGATAAAAVVLWAGSQVAILSGLLRPRSRLFCPNVWRGARQPRVALTFDDGPHPQDTPAILEVLEAKGCRASFFLVGSKVRAHPDLARRVAAAGHEIGVHSDTHPWWFSLAGPGRTLREVVSAAEAVERHSGIRPRRFRPPMGHKNIFLSDALKAAGLEMVTWSVRAFDTVRRSQERIQAVVLARSEPGSIILMHEGIRRPPGRPSPVPGALAGIIEGLRARGLDPVSLEDLR
jgi:peptidoglycan/xylan/chitin deacetylase (PgdA/CDA1 family)